MSTPALAILLLIRFIGPRQEHPHIKQVLESVVAASAGQLFSAAIPLARESLTDVTTILIAAITVVLMVTRKADSLLIIGGAAAVTLVAGALRLHS